MDFIKKNGPGIGLCLTIAVPAWLLGKQFPVILGACCWAGITAVSLIMQHVLGIW